jgi:hypothetical protein
MNIDERLEALARSMEHHDRQIETMLGFGAQHDARIAKLTERIAKLTELVAGIAEGTARLLHNR